MSGCPSIASLFILDANPQHIPFLVVLIGIPFFKLLRRIQCLCHVPSTSMLSRIWIGLFTALFAEALQTIYGIFVYHSEGLDCPYLQHHIFTECLYSSVGRCAQTNFSSKICSDVGTPNYYMECVIFLLFLLYGISYLLVFMTTLEFICAQSPNSMKGLLIGIWYSLLSIKYLLINNLDRYYFLETNQWSIYNGFKGFGIFLSIAFFSFVSKHYHYRERNEVVNEQAIIEEQYERELLMNESCTSYDDSVDDV